MAKIDDQISTVVPSLYLSREYLISVLLATLFICPLRSRQATHGSGTSFFTSNSVLQFQKSLLMDVNRSLLPALYSSDHSPQPPICNAKRQSIKAALFQAFSISCSKRHPCNRHKTAIVSSSSLVVNTSRSAPSFCSPPFSGFRKPFLAEIRE